MNKTLIVIIIFTGLIVTACGSQPTESPASPPTEEPAPTEQAPTNTPLPTDTPSPTEIPTLANVSFNSIVSPLLQSRCKVCHGGDRGTEEGLDMTSYANLMAGSDNGPVIIPGDAENSLLVELIANKKMPKRGPKLSPSQVQVIVDWINQGALDN